MAKKLLSSRVLGDDRVWVSAQLVRSNHDMWTLELVLFDSEREIVHTEHMLVSPSQIDIFMSLGVPVKNPQEEMLLIFKGLAETQRQLSITFGISESHVSLIVNGKKPLPHHVVKQMGYESQKIYVKVVPRAK